MSTTLTRCWAFTHADGPTKGEDYEYGEGSPHFPTPEAAKAWLDGITGAPALELVQFPRDCHTITCAGCGALAGDESFGQHHATDKDAKEAALESEWNPILDGSWRCPSCA